MNVAVIWDNLGPYHLARLRAAAQRCDLLAVEVAATSADYAWSPPREKQSFRYETLVPEGSSQQVKATELQSRLTRLLNASRPDVVFVPGWSSKAAFAALLWCARTATPAVAMSESNSWDETRFSWKEYLKKQLVNLCGAALVGGNPQRDYLQQLGMPRDRIFLGYDAVDNDHFRLGARSRSGLGLRVGQGNAEKSPPYFLASARFIPKKNLPCLLQAYGEYRQRYSAMNASAQGAAKCRPWGLVLLGDGAFRDSLRNQISELNLHDHVQIPGFVQYPELPGWYAGASAFVHASTTEQWGLVVNEAMAAGLPVLVSDRCGCAVDLVKPGENGYTFDPYQVDEITLLMCRLTELPAVGLTQMGIRSAQIIQDWGPEAFAEGLARAASAALRGRVGGKAWKGKLLLTAMLRK